MKKAEEKVTENKNLSYDSNPFTLAFNSFGRIFNTNLVWAIVFLVFAFFGAIGQFAGNLADVTRTSNSSYEQRDNDSYNSAYDSNYNDIKITDRLNNDDTTAVADDSITGLGIAAIILLVAGISVLVLLFAGVAIAIGVFVSGMFTYVALQSEKGKTVEFAEAWNATVKRFWRLLGAQLLAGLKIFAWTLLLIVPGIIAAFRYALLPYVVMSTKEDEKGIKATHDTTKLLVKGRLMEVFGIATVAGIVPFVGSLLQLTGNAALYTQLKAYNEANLEKPKVHWLNYLGFMLLGALLLFALFIGGIILLVALANR